MAMLGSLTSSRVSEKILGFFNIPLDKITVWRCVQKVGSNLDFDLDLNEEARGEADGTGIPIQGIKKRGRELKVFVQQKASGGVRVAGLAIGRYDGGWDKLFSPLVHKLRMFPRFLLVTDGDMSILKGIKGLNIIFQRCLWHIPYQMRYYLWKDGVERKSRIWRYVISELLDVTAVRTLIYDEKQIESVLQRKTERLEALIAYCTENGLSSSASHLRNALPDMFSAFKKRLNGSTTSKVERVMRTVNLRINVGKWSTQGALNAVKVRLAHYYNDFDVQDDTGNISILTSRGTAYQDTAQRRTKL